MADLFDELEQLETRRRGAPSRPPDLFDELEAAPAPELAFTPIPGPRTFPPKTDLQIAQERRDEALPFRTRVTGPAVSAIDRAVADRALSDVARMSQTIDQPAEVLDPLGEFSFIGDDARPTAEEIAEAAQRSARFRATSQFLPPSPIVQAIGEAESFGEAASTFSQAPVAALRDVLSQSAPAMNEILAGQAVAGPVGAFLSSFNVEQRNAFGEAMASQGVDLRNPDAIVAAASNPNTVQGAREHALRRGLPVAVFDAMAVGLNRIRIGGPVANVTGQAAGESALGAAGEAGAQLASTGEVGQPGEVFLEGVAEAPTALPGVAIEAARQTAGQQQRAGGPDLFDEAATVSDFTGQSTADAARGTRSAQPPQLEGPARDQPAPGSVQDESIDLSGAPPQGRTGPDLFDEAEAVQARSQPAVDPLASAIRATAVKPRQAAPVQPVEVPTAPPPQAAPPAPAGPSVPGDAVTVFTPDNQPIEARYEVVEAEALIASHRPDGTPNAAFPAERQPRQRNRAASQQQIQSIARSLNPALIEQSPTTDTGAPIVDAQNIVESGNGRVAAIQLAAREGNAQVLKDHIMRNAQRFGVDPGQVQAMQSPVLVRRRLTQMGDQEQQEFARASNVSGMARFSPAEQAALDADRLTEDDLALFEPGEDGNVLARSNEAFVKRFLERAGSADAAAMRDPQGRANREAVAQIQAAVFQKAYNDRNLVQLAAEDADPDVRNILAGLQRAAPAFARSRGINAEETGGISDDIVRAIQLFRSAKQARQNVDEYLSQQGLFGTESEEAAKIASFIAANTRSAKTLGDAFEEMGALLENELVRAQNLSMFDGLDLRPGEIISHGIETAQQRRAERSGPGPQQGLFETREEPGTEPAPGGRGEGQQGQDQRRAGSRVSDKISELGPAPFEVRYDGESSQVREPDSEADRPGDDLGRRADAALRRRAGQETGSGRQLDIFAPQARSEARAPKPLVTNARVGRFAIGIDRVNTSADAAHIFAPLRKAAQEQMLSLVTDDAGRPLEIHRHTIGDISAASVYPSLLVAQALSVPGATRIWFAHNHPGGDPAHSGPDIKLTDVLDAMTAEVGLRSEGMIVVSPGRGTFTHYTPGGPAGDSQRRARIPARVRRRGVPVTERRFRSVPSTDLELTAPALAKDYLADHGLADIEGVLMLNRRHKPVGFLEISADELARVGGERGAARALASALERVNAEALIPNLHTADWFAQGVMKGLSESPVIGRQWRVLDGFNNGASMAQAGMLRESGPGEEGVNEGAAETTTVRETDRASEEPGRVTPQRPGDNERGFITRHPLNDIEQAQRKRYARIERSMVSKLSKIGMARDVPDAYRIMLRRFRAAVQKGAREAEEIVKQRDQLSAEHRQLISDYLEGELQQGVVPPENVKAYAAMMQEAIASQTEELIRLGMLSRSSAERWRGRYLTRYYRKPDKPIPKALRKQFNKIDGHHLKGRGMFEMVQKRDIERYKQLGWEIRDPQSDTQEVIGKLRDNDKVLMWRDYTPAERQRMGEVRDAVYRFARGHMETARDIAVGRLFKAVAESEFASPRQTHEDQVQVPDTKIPGTGGVTRYGALAGMWVHKDIWNDLEAVKDPDLGGGEVWRQYMRGLSLWKEGKVALNPVVHSNNIWSSWIMADLYGISPWNVKAYRATLKDYTGKGPFYQEAIDNGLFGTEFYGTEIQQVASELANFEDLEKAAAGKLRRMIDYGARFSGARAYRRGMGRLYRAEDQFFKLLIFKDMREKGATIDEAIDEAERWIFNYMDIPKGVRVIKTYFLPFFSYTYKATPALTFAAVTAPWRYAKWIALFGGANYFAFAALFGPDHEEREEEERRVMPDFMKGMTPFLVQKNIRWPFDRRPGVATYLDLSRRFPMGDLFDMENQMGGVPLPQPLMPNNPVLTTMAALGLGKDSFTGRDIASDADSVERKVSKYMGWLYYQYLPNTPLLPFSYSFDKVMNGVAHEMGEPVRLIPGVKEYTGKNFHGEEQTLARAFGSTTFGFKIREFDVDRQTARMNRELQGKIRDLQFQIRGTARDQSLTEAVRQRQIKDLREQIQAIVDNERE